MNSIYQFYEKYVQSFNIFDQNPENKDNNFIIFYSNNFNIDYKLCNAIKKNDKLNNKNT